MSGYDIKQNLNAALATLDDCKKQYNRVVQSDDCYYVTKHIVNQFHLVMITPSAYIQVAHQKFVMKIVVWEITKKNVAAWRKEMGATIVKNVNMNTNSIITRQANRQLEKFRRECLQINLNY
ncbi:hypothetical protein ABPG73_004171 [Tetrahymena malaccensis]